MRVSEFMVPKECVMTCVADDTIESVVDKLLDATISAVVCVDEHNKPIGMVTKTDIVKAFKANVPRTEKVAKIMTEDVKAVFEREPRDKAASIFDSNHFHHAVVLNKDGEFAGLISSLDIVKECVADDKAWPYNRHVHAPKLVAYGVEP